MTLNFLLWRLGEWACRRTFSLGWLRAAEVSASFADRFYDRFRARASW